MRLLTIDNANQLPESYIDGFWRAGFEGDRVRGIKKGEWMLRKNNYDLVIIGGGEAPELQRFIEKTLSRIFKGFLIYIAEEIDSETKLRLYDLGVDDIMLAPVSFQEILAKIKVTNGWEKKGDLLDENYRLADLSVDFRRYKVFRGNREIRLRKKEFDLLQYLIFNRGIVLNKIVILESVWDINYIGSANTLEVHMLSLRRKIDGGLPSSDKLIHTIHGRGYLFGVYSEAFNPLFSPRNLFGPKKQTLEFLLPERVSC